MNRLKELWWLYASSELPIEEVNKEEKDVERRIAGLNAWFEKGGGSGGGVAKVMDPNVQRAGLVSTCLVAKGEAYLKIPWKLIISKESVIASEPYGAALARTEARAFGICQDKQMAHAVLLCTYLLCGSKKQSIHSTYIEALPRDFRSHPLIRKEGLCAMNVTVLSEALEESRHSMRSFITLCRCAHDAGLPPMSRAQFAWTYLIWITRCIGIYMPETKENCLAFVPMVDMTNCKYSPVSHCSRTIIEDSEDKEDKYAVMRTPSQLRKGDEIFENYGWSSFDYYLNHGFFHHHMHPDESLVCRTQSIYASNPFLQLLLPQRTKLYLRHWQPRLCVNTSVMRFDHPPIQVPPFELEWPFAHFNALWSQFRNHSFLVAVALELEEIDEILVQQLTTIPLNQLLARAATTNVIARAWTRLAELAREEEFNLKAAIQTLSLSKPQQSSSSSIIAFYQNQLKIAQHIIQEYVHQARLCKKPPSYHDATKAPSKNTSATTETR